MGLEYATTGDWPYWGPDVVWSYTRLAGGLQSLLVGIPIALTDSIRSPLFLSNILTILGLVSFAAYVKFRFSNIPFVLILGLSLLLPFTFLHGSVLLNTAYLIPIGITLFITVMDLYCYRDRLILDRIGLYFVAIGFCLGLTFQLHLTWVMFMPFIIAMIRYEYIREPRKLVPNVAMLFLGVLIGGITLWPTVLLKGDMIFYNTGGNLTFDAARFLKVGDLIVKYLGMATFDIVQTFEVFALAREKSGLANILIWTMKFIGAIQFIVIIVFSVKLRKNEEMKKTLIFFGLTMLMALGLFVLGNKHLSARTYIVLFAIPYWISLQVYSHLITKWPKIIPVFYASFIIAILTYSVVAFENQGDMYSFSANEEKIESALEEKDIEIFGKRRKNYMDGTKALKKTSK